MLELGFPIETAGGDWSGTALNHAAQMGHPEVVALLLESGANPEIENEFGGTALEALAFRSWRGDGADGIEAWKRRRTETERQADLVACAELLIKAGARIRPTHLARASEPLAEALRRHGAPEPE